ncbi:MAG: gamma-glutamyltransferase [Deltaproteobacteria bacterium]|nr:gamma-glutamyltransferase [Deltaproteobacteria bacterium]MBK8720073.1 gamma-glutamyltransferase [Deltaproteobacteria bacterium]MBP7291771.1 gamma-glutamyltransferase [Nannocystaceae bacterium]
MPSKSASPAVSEARACPGTSLRPTARTHVRAAAWLALTLLVGAACPTAAVVVEPTDATVPTDAAASVARKLPDAGTHPGVAVGVHGAVASAQADASDVGVAILKQGGNAIDAAVAVGFALAVTHPSAGNIGGGGFMIVRMADGTTAAFDYRERAPGKATRDMYLDAKGDPTDDRLRGAKAAGIPGTVAGLAMAHARFGALPWKDVVAPAIALARDGHVVDSWHAEDLARVVERSKGDARTTPSYFLQADGKAPEEGETWTQPELAATLQQIAEHGPAGFYEGPVAAALVRGVVAAGGIWTAEDLQSYRAIEREPIVFDYRGHTIITMPPPSAGGVVLRQLLAAAEVLSLHDKPWRSVDEVHLYVESARRTYADRNLLLGDPDFVELPMAKLLDVSYVRSRVADIDPLHATPSSKIGAGITAGKKESEQTTHFSVVDDAGNAVSNTYTLNLGFGSMFVAPGTGVLLNNEMDDFAVKPGTANAFGLVQGEQNRIEPGKRMLSSMTPTIVVADGKLRAVLGSPGGPTITTTVSQHVRALVDYGLSADAVVESPRVHHQWLPDKIWAEDRISPELEAGLVARGHEVAKRGSIGHANIIEVDPATQGFRAVADVSRDGGKASAY